MALSPNPYMIRSATDLARVTKLAAEGDPAALRSVRDYRMYALYEEKKEKRMKKDGFRDSSNALAGAILDASDVNVAGKLPPPGTQVLSVKRVGDAERDLYLQRLHEGHARGCISRDVFDARLAAMMAAMVKDELEYLVKDLPDPPVPVVKPWITLKKTPSHRDVMGFLSVTVFLAAAAWTAMTLGWLALGVTLVWGAISAWIIAS